MVKGWFISRYWRLYRRNRKLMVMLKRFSEQNQTAWEFADGNVDFLRKRVAQLHRELVRSEARREQLALKVMAQSFLLRDGEKSK